MEEIKYLLDQLDNQKLCCLWSIFILIDIIY